jgi:hypothetical protein
MVNIDDFTVLCIGTEAEIVFLCSLLYRAGTGQRLFYAARSVTLGHSSSIPRRPSSGVSPDGSAILWKVNFMRSGLI